MKDNDLSVIRQVMQLQEMSMRELTKIWHTLFDHEPDISSQRYMIEKLAYRIQELAYGGLDTETDGKIKACAKEITKRNAVLVSKKSHKFCPMIGTKIVKEYKGKTHEVMVVNDGFHTMELYLDRCQQLQQKYPVQNGMVLNFSM